MSALEVATQVESGSDTDSAGYRLRAARERLDLSIRDVAGALNLMVSHVRGIETDRFAELTNDKQFLRHVHDYAALVELDASEIVDLYRSQSAAAAAQIQARPAKRLKQYDSKWYAVGALAVACLCLGLWSLNQTLPAKLTSSSAKSGSETAQQSSSITAPPAGNDRIEIAASLKATESAAGNASSANNTVSVAPEVVTSEKTEPADQAVASPAVKTIVRSDQAALETPPKQPGKKAASSATSNFKGKNALLTLGAKPLKKTLIELKGRGSAQDNG